MGCQPKCDVTYIRTVVVVVGIEYYYVDGGGGGGVPGGLEPPSPLISGGSPLIFGLKVFSKRFVARFVLEIKF